MTEEIRAEELQSYLEKYDVVFVDCFAIWCGPCKAVSVIFEELKEEFEKDSFKGVKIDIDKNEDFAAENELFAIPSVLVYKNGQRVVFKDKHGERIDKLVGVMPAEVYIGVVKDLLAME
jgi:thioredoxin 1